jgi:hypothetical protein
MESATVYERDGQAGVMGRLTEEINVAVSPGIVITLS